VGAVEKPTYDVAPANVLDENFDYIAVFELETGEVRIQLFDDDAPLHVNTFVFFVIEGFYDDLTFHRVVAGQLAQSGSPNASGDDGAGGFGLHPIPGRDPDRGRHRRATGLTGFHRPGSVAGGK
jgi:peptidylprolyl isomerase